MGGLITLWETLTENLSFGIVGVAAEDIPDFWAGVAIDWAAVIAGIVMLGMFLYGGIKYIISSGEPQKIEEAQKTLINAVIGFAITVLAWSAASLIMSLFGVRSRESGGGNPCEPNPCTDPDFPNCMPTGDTTYKCID